MARNPVPSGKLSCLSVRRALGHALPPAIVWWSLTGGDAASWWFGAPVVTLAAVTAAALAPAQGRRVRVRGLISFIPFFLAASVRGGVDVALRALHPRLPIAPAVVRFEFRLTGGSARVFLTSAISLLPGTLSAEPGDAHVFVHALDGRMPVLRQLRALEDRVAAVFGEKLEPAITRGAGRP